MEIASEGALIETKAEENEERALDALEAAIAALADEMKALRRATDRFGASLSTAVSQTEQIWSSCTELSSSMAELNDSLHGFEQDTRRLVHSSLPVASSTMASHRPVSLPTISSTTKLLRTSFTESLPILTRIEKPDPHLSPDFQFEELPTTASWQKLPPPLLLNSRLQNPYRASPDRLPSLSANSSLFSTPPSSKTHILPRIPHTSIDPNSATSPFTTLLQNFLTPHSPSPELPMKNSNSALMASHRTHGLCSNCDRLHKTFDGPLQSLVPYTEAAYSGTGIPTGPFPKTVHHHLPGQFVSRIGLGVPPTIYLQALEGPLSLSTLLLQGVVYDHPVVVSVDGLEEGLAAPTADNGVLHAVRSPWWLEIKDKEAPGHWVKLSENNAMAITLKSNESLRRFQASQIDIVKAGLKGEGDVVSINKVVLKTDAPFSTTKFVMKLQFSEAGASFDSWVRVALNMAIEFKHKVPVCAKWANSGRALSRSINSHLHIADLQIRASSETGHAFDDTSWEILGVVANAMGNVNARFFSIDHKQRVYKQLALTGSLLMAKEAGAGVGIYTCPPQTWAGEECYNMETVSNGEFGITYLATDVATGENFACKSISKKKLRTAVDIEDVRREVEIIKHLPEHPNIVTLKDTYEDDDAVHIVMELCEGGELFDRIVARGHYTERAAAAVTKTIVEVVQMCHRDGVMHRDLKPENFLFANKKENSPLMAIDFGLSVFFKPGEQFTEIVGSPYYMAPEVLKRNYGPEVDVWSAGVILYILLCGVPPFWAETEQGVAQAIIRSVIDFKRDPWPKVSDNAKDLVKRMLDPYPKKRLTAQEVLDHPWLQNAKKAPNVSLGETVKARLKQFSLMNKLKKKALRVIAEHLSVEEVAGIKEAFDMMDTDKRGKINLEILRTGLRKLGQQVADADLQILMEAADVDGDGTLEYGEFVAVTVHLKKMANDEHLRRAFSFFDKDKSGYIEFDELRDALNDDIESSSEEVINAIMHDVDTDKDGRISYEEFAAMMKAGTDWRKASRQYSRERFNSLSLKLMRDGSLQSANDGGRLINNDKL